MFDYDAELRRYHQHFRPATGIRPHDRVLDVGCGTGQATRDAARDASSGDVLGVDVSARMLDRARSLTDEEGLRNVEYLLADAATHPFPPERFDVCISRFGTMFFDDPVGAFTNVGRALRPDARLVLLVWQSREHNAWAAAFEHARTGGSSAPDPAANHKGAFSLGDPATTAGILTASGFADVQFTDVAEPVYYGPDAEAAYNNALELFDGTSLAAEQRERLRAVIAAHEGDDGVHFDSRAWIVTARRG